MDRDSDQETPLKDYGSSHYRVGDDEIQSHHKDRWQNQAMYVGLHFPKHKKRGHKKHKHRRGGPTSPTDSTEPAKPSTPPAERVKFLLGPSYEGDGEDEPHDIFCEMDELRPSGLEGELEWKETARWIKFEEDVEEEGERWSKPFVATLSLHSLFELRKGIMSGTVMLDMEADNIAQITELVLDSMVANKHLDEENRDQVQEVLLVRHRHQHDKRPHHEGKGMSLVRSLADIGKKASAKNLENKELKTSSSGSHLAALGTNKSSSAMTPTESAADMPDHHYKFNEHFAKKIPAGAEASNILVGEVDFIERPIMAFVRLQKASLLAGLTEVPVPTRFLFILLGPTGQNQRFHEIGRSIATLMSDEVFHEVAYKARNRDDLLAGIDEFLDQVTVLPPGEWDPTIRIEPPKSVPSQEGRKTAGGGGSGGGGGLPNGLITAEPEEEEHGDDTLVRTGRIFGGLINDVKRKLPFYWSDVKDAFDIQCLASFFFIYFACLTPIITFGGLLGAATDNHLAAMESLVSGAICGVSYHLFAGQPLTIVGSTGPVLVFETIVYNFTKDNGLNYLPFRCWIGIWMAIILFLIVMFDMSALVRYITRFTEESFAMLIAIIFIVEAFKKLFHILEHDGIDTTPDIPKHCSCWPPNGTDTNSTANTSMISASTQPFTSQWTTPMFNASNETGIDWHAIHHDPECADLGGTLYGPGCNLSPDVFFLCCLLFIGTFTLSMGLKFFRNTRFLPTKIRCVISDFAVFLAIIIMVGVDLAVGLKTPKLLVPEEFRPTLETRGWLINPLDNPWWTIPATILPSLLATILIFMDQQITAVIVNRKENKLLKGGGYHLDLLCITVQIVICSLVGTPWFVAATVLSINHVRSLTRESDTSAPGDRPKFLGIREQRVTGTIVFMAVGLSALISTVLKFMPMAVLFGVFLFMGVSSVKGIQLLQRVFIIFMPSKYQPDYMFLRHVPIRRVHLFTLIQVLCLAGLWVIKQIKAISIVFPLMVLAMCFIRKALDCVFTRHELKWLDDIMPEAHKRAKEEEKEAEEEPGEQHIEMQGGMVNIPLKEGKSIQIPVDHISYDPATKQVNIKDEKSKSVIWKQLASSDSNPIMGPYQMRQRKKRPSGKDVEEEEEDGSSEESSRPVRFTIAHEDNHDPSPNTMPPPEIHVDPPSRAGSGSKESIDTRI